MKAHNGNVNVIRSTQKTKSSYKRSETHRADVQIVQAGHLQPLTKEMFLHTGLRLEDSQGNGSEERYTNVKLEAFTAGNITILSAPSPQTFNSGKTTLT